LAWRERCEGRMTPRARMRRLTSTEVLDTRLWTRMPLFLQKKIFVAPAGIARMLGYDPEFSEYTKPEGAPVALALLLSLWRHGRRNGT
jgi:hypothetical protein